MGRSCSKRSQDFVFRQALQCDASLEGARTDAAAAGSRLTNGAPISVKV